jgi:hypothetical protein
LNDAIVARILLFSLACRVPAPIVQTKNLARPAIGTSSELGGSDANPTGNMCSAITAHRVIEDFQARRSPTVIDKTNVTSITE